MKNLFLTLTVSMLALGASAQNNGTPGTVSKEIRQGMPQGGMNPFAQNMTEPDFKDVNYAGDNLEGHKLDVYLPKTGKDSYPVVMIIYGSAWFANNAKGMAFMCMGKQLIDAGYAVVSINHRSSGDAKWPAQINDVKGAIRFIRAHAKEYKLDTSFFGITGFSSGGHLSAMAGVTNGIKKQKFGNTVDDVEGNVGGNLDQSSMVDAVVDWFGPVDMSRMKNCTGPNDAKSPEAALIGGDPTQLTDQVKQISPIFYVNKKTPMTLVIHGDKDPVVPYCVSEFFAAELKKQGKLAEFVTVPDGQHGPGTFNENTFKKMIDFFNQQKKK